MSCSVHAIDYLSQICVSCGRTRESIWMESIAEIAEPPSEWNPHPQTDEEMIQAYVNGFHQGVQMNGLDKALWILADQAVENDHAKQALERVWEVQ